MLVVYVSGHGFGHSVRTAVVLRELLLLRPDLEIEVVTDAPAWLFPPRVRYRALHTDIGLVQRDGLEHDEDATLLAVSAFLEGLEQRANDEAERLRGSEARLVLGDVPPLAFEVAARLGVPGIAMGNFSWDDIYQPFVLTRPGFEAAIERIQDSYRKAELLLRLPFHLPMPAFRAREELPLVARIPRIGRDDARRVLGVSPGATAVLLAFGGFDVPNLDLERLGRRRRYLFVRPIAQPRGFVLPNLLEVASQGALSFVDLLAACDAVVTKPGYGMVADLLACRVPALYAERPRFAEYPVLAQALEQHARALPIPRPDLEAGRIEPFLDRLLSLEPRWSELPLDGGRRAALRLAELLS